MGRKVWLFFFLTAITAHYAVAGFFASAIGPAIQTDASSVYYNPASLVLLPHKQLVVGGGYVTINLNVLENSPSDIKAQSSSISNTVNRLPMFFLSVPFGQYFILGFGALYPFMGNQDFPDSSQVRYLSTYESLSSLDLTPTLSYKLTEQLTIGGGVDLEQIKVMLDFALPSSALDIPLINNLKSRGVGWHGGMLFKPKRGTTIGLAYHSPVAFDLTGTSVLETSTPLLSTNLNTKTSLPGNSVLTIDQFLNKQWGIIGTMRYTQWSVIKSLTLYNLAYIKQNQKMILSAAAYTYNLKDTWTFQLGTHYTPNDQFTAKAALTYDDEPINPNFLIGPKRNIILSFITDFKFNELFSIELNYSYMYYAPQKINIQTPYNTITGNSSGGRNALFGKLIWNIS